MNRIYRLVWNMASGLWVAVAENARGRGKGGSSRDAVQAGFASAGFSLNFLCRGALAMLAALMMLPHEAQAANAANASVSAGAAGIATVGNATTINQSSQRVAIDWTSLSTAANEALIFNQPNAQAIALNRITGSSPSEFLGSLTANGQVFILNPNGVLFGAGSQVNVGGLVASTLSMSNADFMNGNHVFTGSGGSVVNQGTLNAAPGGYLTLLAPEVRNEGVMTASLGTALLAAGNKVTLNLDNGSLLGYSIDQGAINALAENKQLIQANGGQVLLSAKAMNSLTTATVNNTGVIEARTFQNKAGRILLMGDMETGTVNVAGTLDASAPAGGDGGFIETSAAHVKVAAGTRVSTLSGAGKTGTWLIDPTDFTISSGSGTQTTSGIGADTLSANLATTSVTLETDASTGSGSGDINVNAAVTWSANTRLTLNAYNNININAAITATGASAGLELNHGNYAATGIVTSGTDYKVGAPITLSGANATLAISGTAYTLIHDMAALDAIDSTGSLTGKYALAGDLDASGTPYIRGLVGSINYRFNGTFAGLGHTISNLTINSDLNGNTGLFGYTDRGSVIRDIGLVGGSVSGYISVGALVGVNHGSISNAYATASVSGYVRVGGLVGESNFGSISNSYATGSVSATGGVVGGLVGTALADNRISNSYATGSVSGPSNVGALAGVNGGTITASFWLNSVSTRGIGTRYSTATIDSLTRGLSASEAASASTYSAAGWGVATAGGSSSVWRIYDGKTMPLLRSFLTALTVKTGDVSKTYDGTTSLNGSYTPVGSSADTSLILGTAAYSTSSKNVGSYAVSTSGLYSGQQGYDISYEDGAATITAATLTVSGSAAASKTYDGTTAATLSGSLTGLISGDTVALIQNGTFSDKNAGTGKTVSYTSSVSGADAGNYMLVSGSGRTTADITAATLTVTGTTAANKTYDGTAAASVSGGALSGLISGDTVALSQSGTFGDKNAAAGKTVSYTSSVSGSDAGNYVLASSSGTTTADIAAATLMVTGTTAANKTYDGTAVASVGGGALSGLVSGDTVALSQSGSFSDKNAAAGKTVTIANSLSGSDAGNYVVAAASTTASISQAALTISGITASDKTYNASDAATVNTAGASYGGLIAGDAVNVAATGLFSDKNAGAGKTVNLSSSYSGADVGNYAITSQASTTATISQAALTVSGITAADKTYNASGAATVSTAGVSYSGLFAGDVVNVAATGQFSDKNAGAGKTVNLSSSYSGADVGNYAITNQATTMASISQANLTVSGITAADKTYNASDVATVNTAGASYSGLFAGDVVNVAATGVFGDKNVGAGKTVALSSSYSGADAGNYAITGQAATTASISQATLTISGITAGDKTYNASDAATVNTAGASYNGLFAGDVVSVAATGLFSDKNAGANKTVNLSSSYSGADLGNYAITDQATTTATIGRAALTVSGITAGDKTYNASTAATVSTAGASYSGLFAGDVVNVAATGLFNDKNAGANKTVNLSSSYSGADAGNYAITSQAGTTATINKADLVVQANGVSKVYDGTTAASVAFSGNGLTGDVLNLTGNASFADQNAGLNKAVSVTGIAVGGADAGNYNLISGSTAATTADITPKQLTVTANNDTQPSGNPYSGGNGVLYNGLATGDTAATVLAGSLAYGGSAQGAYLAGEYEITLGGLLANGNYSLRFVQGRLTLNGGDVASAALGGTVLVGAYDASKNTAGSPSGFQLSAEGGGSGDEAKRGFLNAAAADAREGGGE
ncbi:filamentous hemagglutinin family N-terminal domain-containing protein [Polaromonas sp. YR568]|uniref:YDG domain-containing protein n=1 Tax=Polaromonas sp. YR568 TaxID=1855301 RepID=UPI0008F06365|nr:YDG domain-containing protein [Polaromonas sp. YR568]SFU51919.1 filamentous hemagglutinin family N-terminal domain-containing protein [Polaromonas sp. YR568]